MLGWGEGGVKVDTTIDGKGGETSVGV